MTRAEPDTDTDAAHCAIRLRAAVSQLSRQLRPSLQRGGLSIAKLSALGQLHRSGPLTPTELARREGVKLQSLTRLLAELEAEHWLARGAHPSDGRQSLVSLTRAGARRLSGAVQSGEASLAEAIAARLDGAERRRLLQARELLDRLAQSLADAAVHSVAEAETPVFPQAARQVQPTAARQR